MKKLGLKTILAAAFFVAISIGLGFYIRHEIKRERPVTTEAIVAVVFVVIAGGMVAADIRSANKRIAEEKMKGDAKNG